jgi:DNA polymerase alpha subunit A
LTKNPEDYADKKTQPHVQVALAMKKRGLVAKIGDTIPFVICKGDDSILAARARHPDDFRDSDLQVDYQWYLNNQIHPPVARLCSPIQGTDIARLANCLGLDVAKYQQSMNASEAKDLFTLESTIPEIERFKDVEKWRPKCNICQHQNEFEILSEEACSNLSDIFRCQNAACAVQLTVGSLSCQLLSAMRKQLNRYLEQRVICDDPACHAQTKATSVFGRKCLVKGCKGLVTLEYSDNQLYTQMQYYERLFSLDPSKDAVEALYPLSSVVMRFLNVSARRWVSLDQVFGFLQC